MPQRKDSGAWLASLLFVTCLLSGCAGARVPDVTQSVDQTECRQNPYATSALSQNLGDAAPICRADVWTFTIPARAAAPSPRRTEIVWALHHGRVPTEEGEQLVFDADITGTLGDAGQSDHHWHVFWQIVGQTRGEWKAPNFQVGVRAGQLRLWGGASHPQHEWDGPDYSWDRPLADFVDGRRYHLRIEAKLSTKPGVGRLSAWVDGERVIDNWAPISPTGQKPGTLVPEQTDVHVRSGLYRGTDGPHRPPSYQQDVAIRVNELS